MILWVLLAADAELPNPHREPARAVLERHCGDCHRRDSPRAVDKALRVFTLNDEDFAARMTAAQLADMLVRVSDNPAAMPAADVDVIRKFVAAEGYRKRR